MEAYWIILVPNKTIIMEYKIFWKRWNLNTARVAEAVVLLDLITTVANKCYQIDLEEIKV